MADIEKAKKGCEICEVTNCLECPYNNGDEESVECMDGLFKDVLAAIEQLEKKVEDQAERIAIMSEGGWRDAEKDPPKETDCYIVRIDYGVGQMTTMREYISSECKWLNSIEEKITHWMQLPEPPKEGES